jgi:hypothetical protein
MRASQTESSIAAFRRVDLFISSPHSHIHPQTENVRVFVRVSESLAPPSFPFILFSPSQHRFVPDHT